MKTRKSIIVVLGVAALVACFAFVGPPTYAQKLTTYKLTDLGLLPNQKIDVTNATAINHPGQVTGMLGDSAFCYDGAKKVPMEELGMDYPTSIRRGFGMNNLDQVVGDSTFGSKELISQAALFFKGTTILIAPSNSAAGLVGSYSRANGINDLGQVVGYVGPRFDGTDSRAFIWSEKTGMTDIGTLGGDFAQALAINDVGFLTGNAQVEIKAGGTFHAFLYRFPSETKWWMKPMQDLGTLGGSYSYGTAINDNNHVAGYSTLSYSEKVSHAFLYDGAKMRDLGTLGTKQDESRALGVNNSDEVVGYSYVMWDLVADTASSLPIRVSRQVGFVFSQGVMADLNDLIGPAVKEYHVLSAVAINDKGLIAADALNLKTNTVHAVLLEPNGGTVAVEVTPSN